MNFGPIHSTKRLGFLQKVENANKRIADQSKAAEAGAVDAGRDHQGQEQTKEPNQTARDMTQKRLSACLSPVYSLSRGSQSPDLIEGRRSRELALYGPAAPIIPSSHPIPDPSANPNPAPSPARVTKKRSPSNAKQPIPFDPQRLPSREAVQNKQVREMKPQIPTLDKSQQPAKGLQMIAKDKERRQRSKE